MGGGAEGKVVRRRKRKTRSETSHLRVAQMKQDKRGTKSSQRSRGDVPSSPRCSLGSSKVASAPLPPVTRGTRASRDITQGRLTMGLLPYAKSSDLMTRGPIPETASVKKKVAENMRRIVNPSSSFAVVEGSGDGPGASSCSHGHKKREGIITTIPDHDQHHSAPSQALEENKARQVKSTSSVHSSGHAQRSPASTSSTPQSVGKSSKVKAGPKSNKSASLSTPAKPDHELDEILPVNELADKILKNLRPQFKELFPTRDLNAELNASLKKLLKRSSRKVSVSNQAPVIPGSNLNEPSLHPQSEQTATSYQTASSTLASSSSLFQHFSHEPAVTHKIQSVPLGDACDQSETAIAAQNLLSYGGFVNSDRPGPSSGPPLLPSTSPPVQYFFASNLSSHHKQLQQKQQDPSVKSVQFFLPVDFDSGNDESGNGAHVMGEFDKPSNLGQNHQHHLQKFDPHVNFSSDGNGDNTRHCDHHHRGHHQHQDIVTNTTVDSSSSLALGFALPNAFGDGYGDDQDADKPILIDIARKEEENSDDDDDHSKLALAKYNSFMASARSLKAKLERQKEIRKITNQQLPHHYIEQERGSNHYVYHSTSPVDSKHYSNNVVNRFKFPEDSTSKYPSVDKTLCDLGIRRTTRSTTLADIHGHSNSRPSDIYPTTITSTIGGNHHHHHQSHSPHPHHRYYLRGHHRPSTSDCFSSQDRGEESSGIWSGSGSGSAGSSNLAQSRHRLKTALDSLFMDPPPPPSKLSVMKQTGLHTHNPTESMEWQDVDILTEDDNNTTIFPHDSHPHRGHRDLFSQPLEQLRIHQSDMQHQARTFLDAGGVANGIGQHPSLMDAQPTCHHHHPSSPPALSRLPHHHHLLSMPTASSQTWL